MSNCFGCGDPPSLSEMCPPMLRSDWRFRAPRIPHIHNCFSCMFALSRFFFDMGSQVYFKLENLQVRHSGSLCSGRRLLWRSRELVYCRVECLMSEFAPTPNDLECPACWRHGGGSMITCGCLWMHRHAEVDRVSILLCLE